SACPGRIQAAAVTWLPESEISTTFERIWPCSPPREAILCVSWSASAVFGLTSAALSQVSLVTGFGNSWSQPLLAKRPSYTQGSGRKTNSRSSPGSDLGAGRFAKLNFSASLLGGSAEPTTIPSCSVLRQNFSKSPEGFAAFSLSRRAS